MRALVDEFVRAEAATPLAGASARRLPTGLRSLLVALAIVVALQLLSRDLAEDLGAPDSIQEALAKCIALVAHVLAILIVLVSRVPVSRWILRLSRPGTYWVAVTEAVAAIWPTVAICAIAGSWLVSLYYSYFILKTAEWLWRKYAPRKFPRLYAAHPVLFPHWPKLLRLE